MDIRNVQKTGDMHYLYLPTTWCKANSISSKSKVTVTQASGGKLLISPGVVEQQPKHLSLSVEALDTDAINKLIVACYITPANSFKITLGKGIDYATVLEQKRLLAVDLVEIEGNTITSESSIVLNEPQLLLKTMVSKMRNMVQMMTKHYTPELIQRYEEEIDRNRLLIDKAVTSALTYNKPGTLNAIELHYLAVIAKDLERMADHIILLEAAEQKFLKQVAELLGALKDCIEKVVVKKFTHSDALAFITVVNKTKEEKIADIKSSYRARIRHYFSNVSEILLDWAITNKLERE